MSSKPQRKQLFIRIIRSPYKALCKARDFYIRSITSCATHANYGGSATAAFGGQLSRTTSSSSFGSSADEDLRELIRANSTARMGDLNINRGADLDTYIKQHMIMKQQQQHPMAMAMASRRVARSASVGMGRIDEDAPVSSFPNDEDMDLGTRKVKSDRLMFPRSRSHAVKINRFS